LWWPVLVRILIAATRSEMHDFLHTNVDGFQLFSDEALKFLFTEVLNQLLHTAVLRK
jgi:hypothetical protein